MIAVRMLVGRRREQKCSFLRFQQDQRSGVANGYPNQLGIELTETVKWVQE